MSKPSKHYLLYFLITLFGFINTSQAAIIYVDINVSGGSNDGTSWTNAYNNLHSALANANNGDRIWVAQGTYLTSTTNDKSASFDLVDGVAMLGGFLPSHTTEGERDYDLYPTILSADLNGNDGSNFSNRSDNGYSVIYSEDVNSSTVVDGFVIRGGYADGPGGNGSRDKSGAGWYNFASCGNESSPTILNCRFEDNWANFWGGALFNEAGSQPCASRTASPTIENCNFNSNYGGNSAGAIYNNGAMAGVSSPTIKKCIFSQNKTGLAAGAVYNNGQDGGTSNTYFEACQFTSNESPTSSLGYAGAVYNLGTGGTCSPSFINCQFNANKSYSAGAMYFLGQNGQANPLVLNCLFYGNTSTTSAGALYANGGDMNGECEPNVINCIFWNNTAGSYGGDVFRVNYANINVSYSIVDEADCAALVAGIPGTVTCGSGMLYNQDPQFENILINDFNLQSGSPAIDAGDDTELLSRGIMEDLNGDDRFKNTPDIGPYENQTVPLPVDLLHFSARCATDRVTLNWQTASEKNTSHFIVERARGKQEWKALLTIPAVGFSSSSVQYSGEDRHPFSGSTYYRLRIIDFDGGVQYSPIISVDVPFDRVTIFPNPVAETAYISIGDFKAPALNYQVMNQQGLLMKEGRVDMSHGRTTFSVSINENWTPGIYFVRVYDDGVKSVTRSFIKIGL